MADTMVNIFHVYLMVDYATDPYATLGLDQADAPTTAQVKAAYKSLALWLHPDKAPSEAFVETHTRLFRKIREAQEELLAGFSGETNASHQVITERKAILEGPLSLHQRNLDFKNKLRERREAAIAAKTSEMEKTSKAKDRFQPKGKAKSGYQPKPGGQDGKKPSKSQKKVQEKATHSNKSAPRAKKGEKKGGDAVLCTDEEIAHRAHQEVLGGAARCVSLAEEKRRANLTLAQENKDERWIQDELEPRLIKECEKLKRQGVYLS